MFRLGGGASAEGSLLKVRPNELAHREGVKLKRAQPSLDGFNQALEGRKVAIVGLVTLDVAPQVLNRVVVR